MLIYLFVLCSLLFPCFLIEDSGVEIGLSAAVYINRTASQVITAGMIV